MVMACLALLFSAIVPTISAQSVRREGSPILVGHVGATAAGAVALFVLDEPLRNLIQSNRTQFANDVATVFRQLGEVSVVYPASFGVLGVGLLASHAELKRSGAQMAVSLTFAAGITVAGKFILGRARPSAEDGPWSYEPFTGILDKALPSGHTALAFAFAATLADFTDATAARALIYAAAVGTGWSRLNDDRHWLSDIWLGAVVGITSSKLVTGRWTILGIETPDYFAEPGVEPASLVEVVLGAAAGAAIFRAARLVASSAQSAVPFVAPLSASDWAVGARLRF